MRLKCFIASLVIYRERPVINTGTVNVDYLRSLPEGTFGREYADWLDINVCSCFLYVIY